MKTKYEEDMTVNTWEWCFGTRICCGIIY